MIKSCPICGEEGELLLEKLGTGKYRLRVSHSYIKEQYGKRNSVKEFCPLVSFRIEKKAKQHHESLSVRSRSIRSGKGWTFANCRQGRQALGI